MKQLVENINIENLNTVPQNQQAHTYKEVMRTTLELPRDHYDETYPCVEKVIEECKK